MVGLPPPSDPTCAGGLGLGLGFGVGRNFTQIAGDRNRPATQVGWHEVTGDGRARRRAREIEIARVARRRAAWFGLRREDCACGFQMWETWF